MPRWPGVLDFFVSRVDRREFLRRDLHELLRNSTRDELIRVVLGYKFVIRRLEFRVGGERRYNQDVKGIVQLAPPVATSDAHIFGRR